LPRLFRAGRADSAGDLAALYVVGSRASVHQINNLKVGSSTSFHPRHNLLIGFILCKNTLNLGQWEAFWAVPGKHVAAHCGYRGWRGKASIMAVAERRRLGTAGESSPDCSGCVGAALLRSRRKPGSLADTAPLPCSPARRVVIFAGRRRTRSRMPAGQRSQSRTARS
jgi:hypothetical protein